MGWRFWLPLSVSALGVLAPFVLAVWLVVATEQPIWIKLLGLVVMPLAGLWNLWRARTFYERHRNGPPSN